MGIPFHIDTSARVTLFGKTGRIIQSDAEGYIFEHQKPAGLTERISIEDFDRLLATPHLKIDTAHGEIISRRIEEKQGLTNRFVDLCPSEQMRAIWRKACCDAFLTRYYAGTITRTDTSIQTNKVQLKHDAEVRFGKEYAEASLRAGDDLPSKVFPSERQLRAWLKLYEESGFGIDGLISAYHRSGNRTRRFSVEETTLMMKVVEFYATTQKPTKQEAVKRTKDLFASENTRRAEAGVPLMNVPSRSKLFSILSAQSAFYLKVRRDGLSAARRSFTFRSKGVQAEIPMERVETDENKIDAISLFETTGLLDVLPPERIKSLEKGRRWLYLYIDCATKCILSLHLAASQSGEAAVRSLKDVLRDKTAVAQSFGCVHTWDMHGRPFSIVADHGTAFHSTEFNVAATSLGIGVEHPALGLPHLRGTVESIFKTYGYLLMSHLAGRTFSNVKERGDYPAKDLACLSDDELIGLIITVIVDIYHHQPHEALEGYTPAQAWALAAEASLVPVPPDGHEIRAALGHVHARAVNNAGVTLFRINYECPELRDAYLLKPGQKVRVWVDYDDLGWVSVEIGKKRYAAEAVWDVFKGMSYNEWQATRREILKRSAENDAINQQTVIDAYGRIDETVRRAMLRAEVTPFATCDVDVERTERAMRLTLRDDDISANLPLSELINPPPKSPDPLATATEIKRPKTIDGQCPTIGKAWKFDDE